MARPKAKVFVPEIVRTGEPSEVRIVLESESPVSIDGVEISLLGIVATYASSDRYQHEAFVLELKAKLAGPSRAAARSEYRAIFDVPANAPPSFGEREKAQASVRYELDLRVVIPWWFDVHDRYPVRVTRGPMARPPPAPIALSDAPHGRSPGLELWLDDSAFAPGDLVSGRIALVNAPAEPMTMTVAIVGEQTGRVTQSVLQYALMHETRVFESGREYTFAARLADDTPPTFATRDLALSWRLFALGRPLHPILVHPFDRAKARSSAPVIVGEARWLTIWTEASARHGLVARGLSMHGDLSGCDATLVPHEDGAQLAATLHWPSCELGLSVGEKQLLRGSIDLEARALTKRFRVLARDVEQIDAFLSAPLVEALLAFERVSLDDGGVTLAMTADPHSPEALERFVTCVSSFAREMHRALAHVPPPTKLRDALPSYRAFARDERAHLEVGPMAIRGITIDGVALRLVTCFDDNGHASGAQVSTSGAFEPLDDDLGSVPADQRARLESMQRMGTVAIEPEAITLTTEGVLEDPSALRPMMVELSALARARSLGDARGPYR